NSVLTENRYPIRLVRVWPARFLVGAVVAFAGTGLRAAAPLEECADISPTQAGISVCLDNKLAEAQADLAAKSKLARRSIDAIRGHEQRAKAQRGFERAQRRFLAERERVCGESRPLSDSERGNKVRDCLIRLTRDRSDEIAASLSLNTGERSTPEPEPKSSAPQAEAAPRAPTDPVYGVDWRLTRMIRDNQEVPLPPKYRANLRLETDG